MPRALSTLNKTTAHRTAVSRQTVTVDAAGVAPGRVATQIVRILIGKHKPSYSPHTDCGDLVAVQHVADLRITGQKETTKEYRHYTGYPGGLRRKSLGTLLAEDPRKVVLHAVERMLPKNRTRARLMKRISFT